MNIEILPHQDRKTAAEILRIQKASYAVEAELIGFSDIPPLRDTVETIMKNEETFLGYVKDGQLLGVLSYKEEQDEIDIYRLMVDPYHFRKRVGHSLLQHLVQTVPEKTMVVQTGKGNEPAVNLYAKFGFEQTDEVEVEPDIRIVMLKKYYSAS
ncbi:GNAT family N-acetyltransferase [Halobacillus litoralis]|uniref:GNAT family N-acetyltransferase n=1 Tax=Halobacillus litoralis TaxID=45668 RepID=UPI001CD35425|nr:GNAT family N-acetyltransferase [Halobacillus litoralis]MCA0972538.1 GNAT family N-acetyltransferase [Halobacillus litoralis]